MEEQVTEYRLGDFDIGEIDGHIYWGTWVNLYENEPLDSFHGRGFIESEVNLLILGPWKVHDTSALKDFQQVEQYLDRLPKWDKTRYYIKFGDIGTSPVMICDTDKPAPDDIQKSLSEWWNQREFAAEKARQNT